MQRGSAAADATSRHRRRDPRLGGAAQVRRVLLVHERGRERHYHISACSHSSTPPISQPVAVLHSEITSSGGRAVRAVRGGAQPYAKSAAMVHPYSRMLRVPLRITSRTCRRDARDPPSCALLPKCGGQRRGLAERPFFRLRSRQRVDLDDGSQHRIAEQPRRAGSGALRIFAATRCSQAISLNVSRVFQVFGKSGTRVTCAYGHYGQSFMGGPPVLLRARVSPA